MGNIEGTTEIGLVDTPPKSLNEYWITITSFPDSVPNSPDLIPNGKPIIVGSVFVFDPTAQFCTKHQHNTRKQAQQEHWRPFHYKDVILPLCDPLTIILSFNIATWLTHIGCPSLVSPSYVDKKNEGDTVISMISKICHFFGSVKHALC